MLYEVQESFQVFEDFQGLLSFLKAKVRRNQNWVGYFTLKLQQFNYCMIKYTM